MGFELAEGFDCTRCGQHHDVFPLSFSVKAPDAAIALPPEEIASRVLMTADQCVLDSRDYFLRGRIVIPIHGLDKPFIWGVWAEVAPQDFVHTNAMWKVEGREREPAFTGWLASELFPFHNTSNLKLEVQTRPVGERPRFTVLDAEHPLARQQREGISLDAVQKLAELILHRPQ